MTTFESKLDKEVNWLSYEVNTFTLQGTPTSLQ